MPVPPRRAPPRGAPSDVALPAGRSYREEARPQPAMRGEEMTKPETTVESETPRPLAGHEPGHPAAELEVEGTTTFQGRFRGRGRFTLFLSDAAQAKIGLDYRSPDSVLLSVESTAGIRLSADDTLTLSGGLSRDLVNQEIRGRVAAKLRIARDLSAEIEQEFGASGPKTSVAMKLRI